MKLNRYLLGVIVIIAIICVIFKVENYPIDGGMLTLNSRFGFYKDNIRIRYVARGIPIKRSWRPYFSLYLKIYHGELTDVVAPIKIPTGNKVFGNETVGIIIFNN